MAYVKNIWVDQDVERPKTYEVTNNQDGSITLTDSFGLVTELGTPVNEVNMNHIEDGIDGCAIRKHNLTETFNLGEWVLGGTGDDEGIYKSLVANNVGNAISDDTKWEKVEMGGNSRNIGEIVASTIPLTDAGLHLLDGALLQYGSYQAFIDYIADLYDNSSWISWTQPVATSNETPITGGKMICSASSQYDNSYAPWKAMDNVGGTTYWASPANTTTGWWQVKFPYPIKITGLTFYSANNTRYCSKDCRFYTSSDMTTPIGEAFVGSASANTSTVITGISADGIITDTIYLNVTSSHDYGVGLGNLEITATKNDANYFTTETNWQTAVTTYGVCGKFVYDSVNNTVRLPKVTGIIEGTTDVTSLGDLVEAGLPNITGSFCGGDTAIATGAFTSLGNNSSPVGSGSSRFKSFDFDASRISSIYGNSTTVQPQTVKAFYYIVIATSTKTEIQVDIDEIVTDLNGKADVDLSNVPTSKGILTESYVNGASWYRVYSDGWCEQGGVSPSGADQATVTITLLKAFSNTSYTVASVQRDGPAGNYTNGLRIVNYSTNSFQINYRTGGTATAYWVAYGYTN